MVYHNTHSYQVESIPDSSEIICTDRQVLPDSQTDTPTDIKQYPTSTLYRNKIQLAGKILTFLLPRRMFD